jgi:hypothetical protein
LNGLHRAPHRDGLTPGPPVVARAAGSHALVARVYAKGQQGSARRECFDHVIALNEPHVRRIAREFISYYHEDRTHIGLNKDTPLGRPIEVKPDNAQLESLPRVGGLHHRYLWKTAA